MAHVNSHTVYPFLQAANATNRRFKTPQTVVYCTPQNSALNQQSFGGSSWQLKARGCHFIIINVLGATCKTYLLLACKATRLLHNSTGAAWQRRCSAAVGSARHGAVARRTSAATHHVFWSRTKKRLCYYRMRSTMKVFVVVIILSLASFAMGQSRSGQTPAQVAYDQAKEQQSKASVAAAAAQMLFDSITSEANRLKQDMQKSQSDAAMWKAQCESDSNAHLAASVAHGRFKNVTNNVTRAEKELAVVQQLRQKLKQVTFTTRSRILCFCHVTKLDTFLLSSTFSSPTSKLFKHRMFRLTATSTLSNVPFLMHPPNCVRQPLSCSPISWHSSAVGGTSPKRDKLAS